MGRTEADAADWAGRSRARPGRTTITLWSDESGCPRLARGRSLTNTCPDRSRCSCPSGLFSGSTTTFSPVSATSRLRVRTIFLIDGSSRTSSKIARLLSGRVCRSAETGKAHQCSKVGVAASRRRKSRPARSLGTVTAPVSSRSMAKLRVNRSCGATRRRLRSNISTGASGTSDVIRSFHSRRPGTS